MTNKGSVIYYTNTDEAPFLASQSLLPVFKFFLSKVGIEIRSKDISLAGRILAQFPECLEEKQRCADYLSELGALAKTPDANIIKLPNISASIPQLKAAIKELQDKGHKIPSYPENPIGKEQELIKEKYAKVLGSAVNPVLREGNSDRRVAKAVKDFARENPHKMGQWHKSSKTHVAHMNKGDFYETEKSVVAQKDQLISIEFIGKNGERKVLKEKIKISKGDVFDASTLNVKELRSFYKNEIEDAKKMSVLLSLHLKATMMKVSDPIIFGHALSVYFAEVFKKYESDFKKIGVDEKQGLGDLLSKIESLEPSKKEEIKQAISSVLKNSASVAMVDSKKGITNLHVPSDVIIDASMPAAIREGGKMWDADGKAQDTKALIPDRCYAGVYQETIDFCKQHGTFDVTKMGSVANVGLMAQKAEEYGSHDKTFCISDDGKVNVISEGQAILSHNVEKGDLWRMCVTKDVAIVDWVKLAVSRARLSGQKAIFWLDEKRSHDENLITLVKKYLKDNNTSGLDIEILNPKLATRKTLELIKSGVDVISVTGNVLRDYLTDLFPILELGTSAKMLSIVPLLDGGGLFETGAGGSAPKHVQQLIEENHLRWDSLGEFLAMAVSLEDIADKKKDKKIKILAQALDKANAAYLKYDKAPSRTVGELDNRGSHYYLARYWAEAMAEQNEDQELSKIFAPIAKKIKDSEQIILSEFKEVQGQKVDIGGYYYPDQNKLDKVMRPSKTLNALLAN